jgi:hypothetical protein
MAAACGSPMKAGQRSLARSDNGGGTRGFGPTTSGAASDRGAVGTRWQLYRRVHGRREPPTAATQGATHGHKVNDRWAHSLAVFPNLKQLKIRF